MGDALDAGSFAARVPPADTFLQLVGVLSFERLVSWRRYAIIVIVVLVAGANKADAVYAALEGPLDVKTYPAQLLRSDGDRVEWFLERAAAARL